MKKNNNLQLFVNTDNNDLPREKVLLISVDKLKKNSYVDLNVDDKSIRVAIDFIQDLIIKESIGDNLFYAITDLIVNNNVTGLWKELLETYIHPIFYYGVVAELSIPLSFKNRNIGTFQAKDEKIEGTSLSDIKYLNQYYNNKRDFYISQLQDFLRCNQCFKKFRCPCDNIGSGFSIPINIKI